MENKHTLPQELYQLFVTYDNYKGGVNNLQVCKICPVGKPFNFIRVYSSTKGDEAIKRAKRWAKKNNINVLQSTY